LLILEEVRAQRRAVLEAIQACRDWLEGSVERLERENRERDEALAGGLDEVLDEAREQSSDLTELKRLYLRLGRDLSELRAWLERGGSGPGGTTPPSA